MNRRIFLQKGATLTAAGAISPLALRADTGSLDTHQPAINHFISANHGHELKLDLTTALRLLQMTHAEGISIDLNIQGQSRHPHTLSLHADLLLEIFLNGEIEIESSFDAGHTHRVQIQLELDA